MGAGSNGTGFHCYPPKNQKEPDSVATLENQMKNIFIALATLSALVLCAACGGETSTAIPATRPAATDTPTTIAASAKTPTLAAIASDVCAPGETPPFITQVVLAKDAQGANFEPIEITENFKATQETLHAVVTLQDAPDNLQLGATWRLMQAVGYTPQQIDANTLQITDGGSRNVDFTLKGTQPAWPVGAYCVEIYVDGKLAVSKPFHVIASSASPNADARVVTDIVLATDAKPVTFEPVNPTNLFTKNAEAIHAVVKIQDAPANTLLRAQWYPPNQEPLEFKLPPVDGTRWLDFRLTPTPDGFPPGEYKVEIYVNDQLVDTKTFTVQ